eukprot:12938052-Prorocentrum_lima.AAC.1
MWVRSDGPTRRSTPFLVEVQDGGDDNDGFDLAELEEEVPLTALKAQCQSRGEYVVAALQQLSDPKVLRTL